MYDYNHGYELINEDTLSVFFYEGKIFTKIPRDIWHEQVEIIYALQGDGVVTIDSEEIHIKTGDFCVIDPMCIHTFEGLRPNGIKFYNIVISNSFCNYNDIDIQNYKFDTRFSDSFLFQKLCELRKNIKSPKTPLYYARISATLLEFTIHLVENHATPEILHKTDTNYNISVVIGYMKENLRNKITVDELAEQAGLSKAHFQRKFRHITGFSAIEYVNILRCNEACRFLRQKPYSVYDVFHMFSFDNYSYFAKMFKKHIGVSPSEYKKSFFN